MQCKYLAHKSVDGNPLSENLVSATEATEIRADQEGGWRSFKSNCDFIFFHREKVKHYRPPAWH